MSVFDGALTEAEKAVERAVNISVEEWQSRIDQRQLGEHHKK